MHSKVLRLGLLSLLSFVLLSAHAPKLTIPDAYEIEWITSFEELEQKLKEDPKPVMFKIYTPWCHNCKKMSEKVFPNHKVKAMLDQNYYAFALNAERKDTVHFKGQTFVWRPTRRGGGYNPVTDFVSKNKTIGYPTIAIMGKDGRVRYAESAYHNVNNLMYALDRYKKQ